MILQRKTLVSTKEQIQKELEKLLKKVETLEAANSQILIDKKDEIVRLTEDARVTVQGLKEESQRSQEVQEKLENDLEALEEERNELRSQLEAKTQEFNTLEENFQQQMAKRGIKKVKESGINGILNALDLMNNIEIRDIAV